MSHEFDTLRVVNILHCLVRVVDAISSHCLRRGGYFTLSRERCEYFTLSVERCGYFTLSRKSCLCYFITLSKERCEYLTYPPDLVLKYHLHSDCATEHFFPSPTSGCGRPILELYICGRTCSIKFADNHSTQINLPSQQDQRNHCKNCT